MYPMPISHNNRIILTTQQIADEYGTAPQIITNNFNRNKERYTPGKHFHRLEGEEKRDFLNQHQIDLGSRNAKYLYLWTERGAFLHAKSLGTDKAWEVYEHLVETYFRSQEQTQIATLEPVPSSPALIDLNVLKEYRLFANNKNMPASQKAILLDVMFKQITGQDAPKTYIPKRYVDFDPGLNRIAWVDIDGIRHINISYNQSEDDDIITKMIYFAEVGNRFVPQFIVPVPELLGSQYL